MPHVCDQVVDTIKLLFGERADYLGLAEAVFAVVMSAASGSMMSGMWVALYFAVAAFFAMYQALFVASWREV